MAGTIPTVVDYGVQAAQPDRLLPRHLRRSARSSGWSPGSSWTTAGTLGVAFVGMAKVMGLSEATAAGAVICGAYFGDKMTPLSETTILVPQLVGGGLTVSQHIRNMFWTAGAGARPQPGHLPRHRPRRRPRRRRSAPTRRCAVLRDAFNIAALNLLPIALLVVFTVKKAPPFLAILGSALFAGILACFTQWTQVKAFVDEPGPRRGRRPGSRRSTPRWRPAT